MPYRTLPDQEAGPPEWVRQLAIDDPFYQAFESAATGQALVGLDGHFLRVNQSLCELVGYSVDELVGRHYQSITHPDDVALGSGESSVVFEKRYIHNAGHIVWVQVSTSVVNDHAGQPQFIISQMQDVTARKQAETALAAAEAKYRALVEQIPAVLYTESPALDVTYISPQIEQLTGYSPAEWLTAPDFWLADEIVGQPLWMLAPDDRRDELDQTRQQLVAGEPSLHIETVRQRKDGSLVDVAMTISPMHDAAGQVIGTSAITHDISERKQAEARLQLTADISRVLAESLDLSTTLQQVAHLVVPGFADWCTVTLFDDDGVLHRLAISHVDPAKAILASSLLHQPVDVTPGFGLPLAIRTGQPVLYPHLPSEVRVSPGSSEPIATQHALGMISVINVPLIARDRTLGGISFVYGDSGRRYTAADLELAGQIARRAASAIDNAQLFHATQLAEAEYRTLVEQMPAVMFRETLGTTDDLYVSPQIERLLGYPVEEWQSSPAFRSQVVHPADRERFRADVQRTTATHDTFDLEYRYIAKDGEPVWVRNVSQVVHDAAGNVRVRQGFISDVTERVEAEARLRESEQRFRTAFDDAATGVAIIDADGLIQQANWAYCEMLGYPLDELIGLDTFTVTHPDDVEQESELATRMREGGRETSRVDKRYIRKDGGVVWGSLTSSLVRDPQGNPQYFIAQVQDITERKHAELELRDSEARYAAIIRHFPAGAIMLFDHDLRYLVADGVALDAISLPDKRIVGKTLLDVVSPAVAEILEPAYRSALSGTLSEFEMNARGRDFLVNIVPIRGDHEEVLAGMVMAVDITERKQLERQITHQAFHDSLTGLPNRALLLDRLDHALEQAQRHGGMVATLFIDLDNFKVVNDSLGHASGDVLLLHLAQRLKRCIREEDTIARFGGDEFVVVLGNSGTVAAVEEVAARLLASLTTPVQLGEHQLFVTCSIGIAVSEAGRVTRADLLRHADIALYRVKAAGTHHYEVFDESMHARAFERLELERDLRGALSRQEFHLVYQPIVDLGSGTSVAFEALIRWQHPSRGLVPPAVFIPVAEATGLIGPIGEWVIQEGCRQLSIWRASDACSADLRIHINLAAKQFQQVDLRASIERALAATGLPATQLTIEITESDVMADAQATLQRLHELTQLGIGIAIDDFGTGYSSLAYLHEFPADILKIDRSFVSRIGRAPDSTAIVAAMIALAQTLGLRVVAEGIETLEQLTVLQQLGCDCGQGYYFAKPQPADAIVWHHR